MLKAIGADGNSNHLGYTKHPFAKAPYPKKAKKIKQSKKSFKGPEHM